MAALSAQTKPAQLPRFEDNRVPVYAGKVVPPRFGDPAQYTGSDIRCFGLDGSGYPSQPPNFAGHFVIGTCTCGSVCHYLFMWDARTGKLYRDLPLGAFNVGPYSGDDKSALVEYSGESFRLDSRLLIIDACREDTCDCGKRYYVWTGTVFRLVTKRVSMMPPSCRK
jgi:hypothetical protein